MKPAPFPTPWLAVDPDVASFLSGEAEGHPRWADVLNRWGLCLLATGRIEDALAVFERAVEINPRYAWACINRLQTVALLGDPDRARDLLEEAPEPAPGVRAYVRGALAIGDTTRNEASRAGFPADMAGRPDFLRLESALHNDPAKVQAAHEAAARMYAAFGAAGIPPCTSGNEPAIRLSFFPGLHQLFLEASGLEARLGRWNEAEASAFTASLYWFNRGAILHQQGFAASLRGEDERALQLWEAAAQDAPEDPRAPIALAYHWSAAGELEHAQSAVQEALRRAPRYADLHLQMGLLFSARGERERALASFRNALELNPNYAVARLEVAVTLFDLERWPEARDAFNAVVDAGLDSSDIELRLGRIEEVLGNRERAARAYREAIRLNPTDPLPHYHLGCLHRSQGNRPAAKKAWRRFLELEGDPTRQAEVRAGLDALDH